MTLNRFLCLVCILSLFVSGCKKYDQNGSLLHLRTPEARLVGHWLSAEVTQVGTTDSILTDFMASGNLLLDATFSDDRSVVIVNIDEDITYEGLWEFNEDKSVLHLEELTFTKVTGPFYVDGDAVDQTDMAEMALAFLSDGQECNDAIFFSAGTHTVVTDEVMACYNSLTATGSNWILADGTLNHEGFEFAAGDIINDAMASYIEGFVNDEMLGADCMDALTSDCISEIVALILADSGADVEYVEILEPIITGWEDPGLFQALSENCGLDVVRHEVMPTGLDDPTVLGLLADNVLLDLDCDGVDEQLDMVLTASFVSEVKVLDLYWEMLELELDDMQAYQFREYNGESVADFNFLLRFEKQN